MRGLAVLASIAALALVGSALAARGDPQRMITPGDQARAQAMLVRGSDLGPRFSARPSVPRGRAAYCRALDRSDLTVTGEATSRVFAASTEFVSSSAYLYESSADSDAAWKRLTSAAGLRCARAALVGRVESFEKVTLPTALGRSLAVRATVSMQGIRSRLVLVALQRGRAHAGFVVDSVVAQPSTADVVRIARSVSERMKTALRRRS